MNFSEAMELLSYLLKMNVATINYVFIVKLCRKRMTDLYKHIYFKQLQGTEQKRYLNLITCVQSILTISLKDSFSLAEVLIARNLDSY